LVPFRWRIFHRRKCSGIIMYSGINHNAPVWARYYFISAWPDDTNPPHACIRWSYRRELIDSTSLNINTSDFSFEMCGKDGQFYGATPCIWFKNGRYVLLRRSTALVSEKLRLDKRTKWGRTQGWPHCMW
jgi:hypothetical protein